ncbi:Verru_Chthon cassette protein B [Prosthecobacter sp.]|uniref:Verru_Chthon cassette protein B n=1 Tax=Prosthecobacter sp. TaxID=1965333 RepID=UPI003784D373
MTAHSPRRPASAGFSLVEVTLAVAIAALAIITLLGLMPQGLEMSRKTGILTLNSNIIEQIIRDLENTQFSLLPPQGTGTPSSGGNALPEKSRRYFNDQGQEVEQQSGQVTFVAEIDFSQPASLPKTEQMQRYLRRVIIRIATTANPDFQFGENNRIAYTTFNHLLAKTR